MPVTYETLLTDFRLLVITVCILSAMFLAVWVVDRIVFRAFVTRMTRARVDLTTIHFVRRFISIIIYVIGISAALSQIPEFKIIGHSLLAGAGILTIVGGLAAQQVLSNLVSGFLIIFFRPFKIGDKITISSVYSGYVEDITLRETVLRDFENNRVIVPNSQISSQILVNSNHTDNRVCKFIDIGIGYSSDVESAMAIMAEEIAAHPLHIDHRTEEQVANGDPEALVRVLGLGSSSVNLRGWAWADNLSNGFALQCDLLLSIKRRFDQQQIEIPFPQTTVTFAGSEALAVTLSGKTNDS